MTDFMSSLANYSINIGSLKILDFLNFLTEKFNFGEFLLYFLGAIINILPVSPVQAMLQFVTLEDFHLYSKILNNLNWIIPFDIFCNILTIWIPFVFSLYAFRISWSKIWKIIEGVLSK